MADNDTSDPMPANQRFVHGPRTLGALVPRVARPVFKRHSPATAQVLADWDAIVGPKVASMATPRRLDRGVLTIACTGPTAMELHYVGVELMQRINTHLGSRVVHSLKFTQAGTPRQPQPRRTPPPEAIPEAERAVAGLPDGDLKTALESLGRVVIGRQKSR
jgi:hypothetical protein